MGFVQRAFTTGGGEAPEAVAQREAAQARINAEAATKAALAAMPAPPKAPKDIAAGTSPGAKQRVAQGTATTMLGAAATGGGAAPGGGVTGEKARKTVLG